MEGEKGGGTVEGDPCPLPSKRSKGGGKEGNLKTEETGAVSHKVEGRKGNGTSLVINLFFIRKKKGGKKNRDLSAELQKEACASTGEKKRRGEKRGLPLLPISCKGKKREKRGGQGELKKTRRRIGNREKKERPELPPAYMRTADQGKKKKKKEGERADMLAGT